MAGATAVTRRGWANLVAGLVALGGAGGLAACGGGGPGGEPGTAGQTAGPASIRVMHRGSNQAQLDELEAAVALFNGKFASKQWKAVAEYHNTQSGSYDEKLLALLVGRPVPAFSVLGLRVSPARPCCRFRG
jgi:hypothetical protein